MVFHIYFPEQKGTVEKQAFHTTESIHGGTEWILLVDDEKWIIVVEKQTLERLGYQVDSYNSSQEAIEAFRACPEKFDLVITDLSMSNMPGDKLAAELTKICLLICLYCFARDSAKSCLKKPLCLTGPEGSC